MKLDDLIDEFRDLEPAEKLEWLVEFSDHLPELSAERLAIPFPETCRVEKCQTTVYLWVDQVDGRIRLEADVPRSSPIVRGLVALLVVGLTGESVIAVRDSLGDLISKLDLNSALGMTRQQGLRDMVGRLKQAVRDD